MTCFPVIGLVAALTIRAQAVLARKIPHRGVLFGLHPVARARIFAHLRQPHVPKRRGDRTLVNVNANRIRGIGDNFQVVERGHGAKHAFSPLFEQVKLIGRVDLREQFPGESGRKPGKDLPDPLDRLLTPVKWSQHIHSDDPGEDKIIAQKCSPKLYYVMPHKLGGIMVRGGSLGESPLIRMSK